MARKKEVYKIKPLNENKKNIISALIDEYDIQTAEDIQEALKDLLGGTIKTMMESEMDEHLGYDRYERSDSSNYRNGTKSKKVRSSYGEFEIDVPQDRNGSFEPQIVKKRQKDISEIDQKIISMYARGMTTSQISEQIEEIYGFECSEGFISDVTDKILQEIDDWQKRPLEEVYPVMYIDAVHFSVREDNIVKKLAAYVIIGIDCNGMKSVISLQIGENESSKYWLGVLNELKNRGVKDVMVICADGLTGIKEAIQTAFPMAEYQRCIVHMVRNTLRHVYYKDMKTFAADLKKIYLAPTEKAGFENMQEVAEKWSGKYPAAMKRWEDNWDVICPIFKFSSTVRKAIYTTNAIESLNSTYKRLNSQRSVFPSDKALLKALYLSTLQATKKWTQKVRNWGTIMGEFSIMYPNRIPDNY
ncbi:MAG: IS256 family transposase [Clostridia bacterium]|nr:IS256 family transposase [Clostridia bacterium]